MPIPRIIEFKGYAPAFAMFSNTVVNPNPNNPRAAGFAVDNLAFVVFLKLAKDSGSMR